MVYLYNKQKLRLAEGIQKIAVTMCSEMFIFIIIDVYHTSGIRDWCALVIHLSSFPK